MISIRELKILIIGFVGGLSLALIIVNLNTNQQIFLSNIVETAVIASTIALICSIFLSIILGTMRGKKK